MKLTGTISRTCDITASPGWIVREHKPLGSQETRNGKASETSGRYAKENEWVDSSSDEQGKGAGQRVGQASNVAGTQGARTAKCQVRAWAWCLFEFSILLTYYNKRHSLLKTVAFLS